MNRFLTYFSVAVCFFMLTANVSVNNLFQAMLWFAIGMAMNHLYTEWEELQLHHDLEKYDNLQKVMSQIEKEEINESFRV